MCVRFTEITDLQNKLTFRVQVGYKYSLNRSWLRLYFQWFEYIVLMHACIQICQYASPSTTRMGHLTNETPCSPGFLARVRTRVKYRGPHQLQIQRLKSTSEVIHKNQTSIHKACNRSSVTWHATQHESTRHYLTLSCHANTAELTPWTNTHRSKWSRTIHSMSIS